MTDSDLQRRINAVILRLSDGNSAEAQTALVELIRHRELKAVEEAREQFFAAVRKADHSYIGQLRRLWIQSVT